MKPCIPRETFAPDPVSVHNGLNGRQASGRFGVGNKAAVGRGRAAKEWHEAARAAISPEMLRRIFAAAATVALKGDIAAARFCVEYCVGKPAQRIDLFHDAFPPMDADDPDLDFYA